MKLRIVLAGMLLGLLPAPLLAQATPQQKIEPAKQADIRRLLDLMGTKKLMEQMMSMMHEQIRSSLTRSLPQNERGRKMLDAFFQKFRTKFNPELVIENVVPIYDKYLSAEDVKGLVQFYESPLGQRMIKVLPEITREAQLLGSQLGQRAGEEAMVELLSEYPELKETLKAPPKSP